MHHIRDYGISNEVRGGSKGESADYLLYQTGNDSCIQYVPVVSKFKLLKRRKTSLADEEKGKPETSHIVMAGRAYSKDEEKQIGALFAKYGTTNYKVSPDFLPFEGKSDL